MSNRHEFQLLEELRAIAQLGLNYSTDHYDLERYGRLLKLASNRYAEISGFSSEHVKSLFQAELAISHRRWVYRLRYLMTPENYF